MAKIRKTNLFAQIPAHPDQEWFQTLFNHPHVKIERIVSRGHRSPPGFWYDQAWDEWVALLKGAAALYIDGEADPLPLAPGDAVLIPAGVRHRVDWTAPHEETIWLAVHLYDRSGDNDPHLRSAGGAESPPEGRPLK